MPAYGTRERVLCCQRQQMASKRQKTTKSDSKTTAGDKKRAKKARPGTGEGARALQRAAAARQSEKALELALEGWSNRTIIVKVAKLFGIAQRTAYKRLTDGLQEHQELLAATKPPDAKKFRADVEDTIAQAREAGQFSAAISGHKLLMRLHGWDEPQQVQVSLPPGVVEAVQAGLGLTPSQRAERIAALRAKSNGGESE